MKTTLALAFVTMLSLASCTDPVRDAQIEALGDDVEPTGPEHRAGQPCVLCHSEGGPAEDHAFAVAGTIFQTQKPGSPGAEGVVVEFIDANGGAPRSPRVTTNRAGNFYVPEAEWPDLAFPFRVRILPPGAAQPLTMKTVVNREGSCNFCHRPYAREPLSDAEREANRSSIGQIYTRTE